jgi:alpha-amylase/alpha-mannosidase (GH57 family)
MSARAVFLWHLHQPEYRDPQSGQPLLPWVRLHSTRAYTDMAAAFEKWPRARGVANWAPSLLLQLDAYVSGRAVDRDEELARRPASTLSPGERAHVVKESFSVDWDLWVKPVPRYAELLARRGQDLRTVDLAKAQQAFSEQDLVDLQIHFMLGWMGFAARREEPLVAALIAKERGFTHDEKIALLDAQRRIAARIVPRWSALSQRGQVELTCSPMYHPILPLLIDSDSARRAMPEVTLPKRFAWPQDAREQVLRGLALTGKTFGARPVGMWPSEGSVSPEVVELLAGCGVRWCATDQGNLERSDRETRGATPLHHQSWSAGELTMLFRDRDLSDAIGFRYARAEPEAAAQELVRRIASAGNSALVTIALDGENPWEHYPRSGEAFLDALYARLSRDEVTSTLPRELPQPSARISRVHSGSWIDSNYRIWLGHPEDNAAWTLLGEARAVLEQHRSSPQFELAYEAILAAEGSDWFWWYGDDFTTENAPEFDSLFRRNVAQVYRHLGLPPPERLGRPIISPHKDKTQAGAVTLPPRRLISPVIDGFSHGYYEWSGSGLHRPGAAVGGSMYQGQGAFAQLCFGFSLTELFLRLDPAPGSGLTGELRLLFSRVRPPGAMPWGTASGDREEKTVRMPLLPDGSEAVALDERGVRCGAGRSGAIVELSLAQAALGIAPGDKLGLLVRLLREDVEVDRLPRYEELELLVPDRSFERTHWQV